MQYEDFRKQVVHPYWCAGSPLAWETPNKVGIAFFAAEQKVGMFNICWWVVGRANPPLLDDVYKRANLWWAIKEAPTIKINGCTLDHHAAMRTRRGFEHLLLAAGPKAGYERRGMTWEQLQGLCKVQSPVKGQK
jgi:hypothetical protein